MTEVRVLSGENIGTNRELLYQILQPALATDPSGMTANTILDWAEQGTVLIFVADQGRIVMALGFMQTETVKIAEMLALAGAGFIKKSAELWPTIERVCREQGCDRVLLHGRPGWRRILDKLGFEVAQTTLAKELN